MTEGAAAQAYNTEAGRLGVPLNVIPPAADTDAGGNTATPADPAAALALHSPAAPAYARAGPKRAAPSSLASSHAKTMRLDTSAGAAGAAGACAAAAVAAHRVELEARIINDDEEGEEEEED